MAPPPAADAKPRDPRYDQKYQYRYEGNKIERTLYYNDSAQGSRTVKTFDDKGNEIKWELYTREGRLDFSKESKYDDKGNEVEETYYKAGGSINEAYKYTDYEVDWDGNWIKRRSWQSKGGKVEFVPYQVERRTISYYGKGVPTQAASGGPPKTIRMSTGVLTERAIKRVAPTYPPGLAAAGIAGEVLIEITVDEQGNVISAIGVSGDKTLAEAAIVAVRQWKFNPTKLSGEPVKVIGRIRFNFNR
jgi:TonB family protein